MNKIKYERATLMVVPFNKGDIITTSGYNGDASEPIVMPEDVLG